jgi:plastocyanin
MRVVLPLRRSVAGAVTAALVTGGVLFAITAQAGDSRAVRVTGTESFVPNAKVMATFRFAPGPLEVRSGDTVTWSDDTGDIHTISVVAQGDLPTDIEEVFTCPVCGPILAGHFDFSTNPPTLITPILGGGADGTAGFDGAGDSKFLFPGGSTSAQITAPAGSTLHYLCAIHPWMQGTIDVH